MGGRDGVSFRPPVAIVGPGENGGSLIRQTGKPWPPSDMPPLSEYSATPGDGLIQQHVTAHTLTTVARMRPRLQQYTVSI